MLPTEGRLRVSLDSNAWEAIFALDDVRAAPVRAALEKRTIEGFICEAAFRIEAITKRKRPSYFAQPHMEVRVEPPIPKGNGRFDLVMSIGPDNGKHPGLPVAQAEKLRRALVAGVKLMSGQNWMGLPTPVEIGQSSNTVHEEKDAAREREQRQLQIFAEIDARGVGKAAFDAVDGWTDRPRTPAEEKQLAKACAEWADGELVAAHVAYQNDILCTNDLARTSGRSIFDATNRSWLATCYGVTCLTLDELIARIGS